MRAKKDGVSPKEIVDKYHKLIGNAFADFGIEFDVYDRTSSDLHHETSSNFFKELNRKNRFVQKSSEQYYDEDFNPSPNRQYGFSFLSNGAWNNITYDSIQQNVGKPVYNLNSVAINPVNSNQIFISSFQHGMLNFIKDSSMELLDDTNSALQSLVLPGSNYQSIRVSDLKFDDQGMLWSLTSLVDDPLKKYNTATNQWQTFSFDAIIDDPILTLKILLRNFQIKRGKTLKPLKKPVKNFKTIRPA